MSDKKQPIQENDFDMARAGTAGAVSYAAGYGTPAGPNVSQDPASFVGSKTLGSHSNTAASAPASGSANDAAIDQIYSKEVTPSPDEVITGLKYELQNMIKKDKARAKEIVLNNLKQDPHYYGKLGMWNIDDKEMMKVNPPASDTKTTSEEQMNERVKLLNQMMEAKTKKAPTPQSIKDALADTKAKKAARYTSR